MAALEQQRVRTEQARRNRDAAFDRLVASRREYYQKRLAQIRELPLEQQSAELDRLQRQLEEWNREERDTLDSWLRENREVQTLNAQQDLADAIRDLSDQIEQSRRRY